MDLPRVIGRLRPGCNPLYADSNATLLSEIVEWRDSLNRSIPTQQECDAEWALCQQEDAAAAQEASQTASAQNSLKPLLAGLAQLSSEDAAYALMGRVMARKDGASQATIDAIVDRASAAAYLTGKTEWVNLTAAAKAWLADQLDMHAVIYQILLIVLRR